MIFRRDPSNLSFKKFIKTLEKSDKKLAETLREKIPLILKTYNPSWSLEKIEGMKWKEIKFELNSILFKEEQTLRSLERLLEMTKISREEGWTGVVRKVE